MQFKEVQQDIRSNEDLCLYLKYPLRLASVTLIGIAIFQIFLTIHQDLQFHSLILFTTIIAEFISIIIGAIGVAFSFKQIHKLQTSNNQYYDRNDDTTSSYLFICNSFILAIIIPLAIINPIISNIGIQTEIAQLTYQSEIDLKLIQQQFSSSMTTLPSLLFCISSLIQMVCIIIQCFIYLLFSGNSQTYYKFIYSFSLAIGCLSVKVFSSSKNINALENVEYITKFDNKFLLEFISFASLVLAIIIVIIFGIDFAGIYNRAFKSSLFKFFLGNVLIAISFAMIGANGQMMRNIKVYQETYQSQQGCITYMQFIPETQLLDLGCIQKYVKQDCSKNQLTSKWEYDQQEACLNFNCCGLITQILLYNYIVYCIEVSWLTVLCVMLTFMLFYIRQMEDQAFSQTLRQIAFVFQCCAIFGGIIILNLSPSIEVSRQIYVPPEKYIAVNNVTAISNQQTIIFSQNVDKFSKGYGAQCIKLSQLSGNEDNPQELISYCQSQKQNEIQLIIDIIEGQFVLEQDPIENLLISQEPNRLYLKGQANLLIDILKYKLSICSTSINSQISYNVNKHLSQQDKIDQIIGYVDIFVKVDGMGKIKFYNTLILGCQDNYNNQVYMEMDIKNNSTYQQFYNYPIGIYGTIMYEQNNYQQCIYFNTNQNQYINFGSLNQQAKLTLLLLWSGQHDLDLIVKNKYCTIGSVYQRLCGGMKYENDAIIGNQQNYPHTSIGEIISFSYLSAIDYEIIVEMRKPSLVTAILSLFNDQQQQQTISQTITTKTWIVGYIRNGQHLEIVNKII